MEEGRRILASERAAAPSQNDPIAALLGQVQPVLEEIDRTVVAIRQVADTLNRDLQGQGRGPLASTLKDVAGTAREVSSTRSRPHRAWRRSRQPGDQLSAGLSDPTGLARRLLDPKGSLATVLDDDNQLYDQISGSLEELKCGHRPAGRVHPLREQRPSRRSSACWSRGGPPWTRARTCWRP